MAKKDVGRVHGRQHTYLIREHSGVFTTEYFVLRDDGKVYGSYSTRAAAFRAAHEKAGPNAYES